MHKRRKGILIGVCLVIAGILLALASALALEGPPGFNPGDFSSIGSRSSGSGGGGGGGILGGGGGNGGGLLGEGIDFKGGMLDWEEDEEGHRVAILRNYAVVILPQLTISARNMVLNVELQEIYAEGDVLFDESTGNAFYCDQLTFNYQEWKGLAKNIRVRMDRGNVELPVRDFLDEQPSTEMRSSISINDATPGQGTSQLKRMYVQASELRAHDQNTFELIDALVTPDAFARPHWYFHTPAALYRQGEKIEAYHNTVRVGRIPVLYFPYLIRDLQYDWPWMRVTGGSTSDYGLFVQSQWGWRLKERPNAYIRSDKVIFDFDLYSRHGVGVGVETTYHTGFNESLGKLKLYGVWEAFLSDSRDNDNAYDKYESKIWKDSTGWQPTHYQGDFRWAVDWEHYQKINDLWDVRAQAHLYHDRDYLKTFDPSRYWNDKEPENGVNVRRLAEQWELEFVASGRMSNKWMNQEDYMPEVRLTVPGMRIGDSPFIFKNDFRLGFINRHYDSDEFNYNNWNQVPITDAVAYDAYKYPGGLFQRNTISGLSDSGLVDKDNYGAYFRAFNEAKLEAPLQFGGMVLKPWVGLRTAYYSKTQGTTYTPEEMYAMATDPTNPNPAPYLYYQKDVFAPNQMYRDGDGKFVAAVPFGADLSTRVYTYFGPDDNMRLITEPVLSYKENTKPSFDPLKTYQVDAYDNYYRERRFGFEMHNKLQARTGGVDASGQTEHRDVMDLNVGVYKYNNREDGANQVVKYPNSNYSEVTADLTYRPTRNLALSGNIVYDLDNSKVDRAIVSADWRINNRVRAYVSQYHYAASDGTGGRPAAAASSQTQLAVRTKLWNDSSHYALEGAVSYEWKDTQPDWETTRDGVRHGFNKYRVSLFRDMDTFEMSLSYIRDRNADNHGVYFNLTPKSFMGYDSPPPGYSVEVEDLTGSRYGRGREYLESGYFIDAPVRDAELRDVEF